MYLALAQQLLLGELPERDFAGPGGPLQYLLSAAAQAAAPGPFTEALLTIAFTAMAVGATCLAVSWLVGSVPAGLAAATFVIVVQPRLYSYPKLLVPAVAVCLALAYLAKPNRWRFTGMAVWIVTAFLLRYDLGGYAALFFAVVLIGQRTRFRDGTIAVVRLAILVIVLLSPYVAFVSAAGGLRQAALTKVSFVQDEPDGFGIELPRLGFGAFADEDAHSLPFWDRRDSAALLVHIANALPLVLVLLLATAARRRRLDPLRAPVVAGVAVMMLLYDLVIIRDPIVSRVADASGVLATAGAWAVASIWSWARTAASLPAIVTGGVRAAAGALVVIVFLAADLLGGFHTHLRETRIVRGPVKVFERLNTVITEGRVWPWERYWPGGDQPELVKYLNACTSPDDRLLLTWAAPEYYFFARRGFASGHVWFPEGAGYRSDGSQQRMIDWLRHQSVPLVLIHEARRQNLDALPLLSAHIAAHYVPVARIGDITVALQQELTSRSSFGKAGWPCDLARSQL